jgi:hypothetical protein
VGRRLIGQSWVRAAEARLVRHHGRRALTRRVRSTSATESDRDDVAESDDVSAGVRPLLMVLCSAAFHATPAANCTNYSARLHTQQRECHPELVLRRTQQSKGRANTRRPPVGWLPIVSQSVRVRTRCAAAPPASGTQRRDGRSRALVAEAARSDSFGEPMVAITAVGSSQFTACRLPRACMRDCAQDTVDYSGDDFVTTTSAATTCPQSGG